MRGATKLYLELLEDFECDYDESGSIGKALSIVRDAVWTPFCITYDFDSEEDHSVTVRHRDSMEQERVKIESLTSFYQILFIELGAITIINEKKLNEIREQINISDIISDYVPLTQKDKISGVFVFS